MWIGWWSDQNFAEDNAFTQEERIMSRHMHTHKQIHNNALKKIVRWHIFPGQNMCNPKNNEMVYRTFVWDRLPHTAFSFSFLFQFLKVPIIFMLFW